MIKIGNVKIINEIVDYDVTKNRFLLIDKLKKLKIDLIPLTNLLILVKNQKTEVSVTEYFKSYSGGTYVKQKNIEKISKKIWMIYIRDTWNLK